MKEYLLIRLYDNSGVFSGTGDESDLELECGIQYMTGEFDTRTLVLNVSTEYTPTSGDKFFFLPGVTVPRVKMKDLHKNHNVKSVRDIEDANIIFVGAKTIDTLTDYSWEIPMDTVEFRKFILTAKDKGLITDYYFDKLQTALEFYTNDLIIIDSSASRLLFDDDISFRVPSEFYNSSSRFMKISKDYVDLYNTIKDKQLCSEDAIYEYINGTDAVSIDQSMYEILCDMFKSDDSDNHVLAMEIMANCDYKSSILYLGYLFNSYRYQIENRRERTHVNFKSLLTYMGRTPGNVHMDKDEMVTLMMKKKLFTKEYFFNMCEKFSDELEYSSSTHFEVKSVSSSDEVNDYFNEELVHQLRKDYQPIMTNELTNPEFDAI